MKITIIGAGHMGGTAARSFSTSSLFTPGDITVTAHSQATLDTFAGTGIHSCLDNREAIKGADVIILAVRPNTVEKVCMEIAPAIDFANQIIISFVAGVPSSKYQEWFGAASTGSDTCECASNEACGCTGTNANESPILFLAMPNTAMELNGGLTFIAPISATPIQISLVKAIFDSVGKSLIIDEKMMNSGMALASCGVAYAMKYILASVDGGTDLGFDRDDAIKVVLQTVKGAAMLVAAHGTNPEEEIAKIAPPGGYTIKGLQVMEGSDFTDIVRNALDVSSR